MPFFDYCLSETYDIIQLKDVGYFYSMININITIHMYLTGPMCNIWPNVEFILEKIGGSILPEVVDVTIGVSDQTPKYRAKLTVYSESVLWHHQVFRLQMIW